MLIPKKVCFNILLESDIYWAIATAHNFCKEHKIDNATICCLMTVISELANNLFQHTLKGGNITLEVQEIDLDTLLIEISSQDSGPGICDIEKAMEEGYSTAGGLGCGLPGVKRLMNSFSIRSSDQGTQINTTKWIRLTKK